MLRKIYKRRLKEKKLISKNLLRNHKCENCSHLIASAYTTRKRCGSPLYRKKYHKETIPIDETCRFWEDDLGFRKEWEWTYPKNLGRKR